MGNEAGMVAQQDAVAHAEPALAMTMATLDSLKQSLRQEATAASSLSSPRQPLSDAQYSAGFDILVRGSGSGVGQAYEDFIAPQLTRLLTPLFDARSRISVLEVGPGPKSVLGDLPARLRRKVARYVAFEPNGLFATGLERWIRRGCSITTTTATSSSELGGNEETETGSPPLPRPFPCLDSPPDVQRVPFGLDNDTEASSSSDGETDEKYDVVLFCHSMYGMAKPKRSIIERALGMLPAAVDGRPEAEGNPGVGMVVVFHRDDGTLDRGLGGGLVCHRTASFPTGVVQVADNDEALDCFAPFIAGFAVQDEAVRAEWRAVCRALGGRRREGGDKEEEEEAHPAGHLLSYSAPDVMVAFTRDATTALSELTVHVPLVESDSDRIVIKNREARRHRFAASIVRPTEVRHVQQCVLWALKHRASLTVVAGSHSGHCLRPHVVAVDMGAFDRVHILEAGAVDDESGGGGGDRRESGPGDPLIVAEAGCKTGDIIAKAMAEGLTVPLGARPSVGAGLWLQGGIGHLARLHGLACDAIVGAVVVSVASGQILCVGRVPHQHRPAGATTPSSAEDEADLLWALKGAGSNFGIVVSVTFRAYAAPTYTVRNWVVPLKDDDTMAGVRKLHVFEDLLASRLPRHCSADAYLYWDADADQLHLGVTMFEASVTNGGELADRETIPRPIYATWGPGDDFNVVDGIGLFDTEMYMSVMHGGHGGGKTSAFKRCIFLRRIGEVDIAHRLIVAVETRPSPLCYLHLLHGGGAIADAAADATAFGCRDWDFACVVTGVWPRDQDGTEAARAAVRWVYAVAADLLRLDHIGAYGADLGPDPRDAALAAQAFGPNRPRLARLKRRWDPRNVLAYACPLPLPEEAPPKPRLIVLVTGKSGVGKDHCADVWASVFRKKSKTCDRDSSNNNNNNNGNETRPITARVASISDAIKREYAAAVGIANVDDLLRDRAYKERHRPALTAFFQDQVRRRPRLPEEHFLKVVHDTAAAAGGDVDVLLITGMRDEAPVATFSHLVPDSRTIEVRVQTSEETRRVRRGGHDGGEGEGEGEGEGGGDVGGNADKDGKSDDNKSNSNRVKQGAHRPCLVFHNDATGNEAAEGFAERHLLPFLGDDLQRLAGMARAVPDFPRRDIEFRHVLGIAQQPGGLALCASLLQARYAGDWARVSAIVSCDAGGPVFASPLASRVGVPLSLVREAGKLPPPTVSVAKPASHISATATGSGDGGEGGAQKEKRIEMERDGIPRGGASSAVVVVVDDVLATGETLCAVLRLLELVGIRAEDVTVLVVAEFPVHRGRDLLRRRGFGGAEIQSLLVFGGA